MAANFDTTLYTFVLTAYATLAVTKYAMESTTVKIKAEKGRVDIAWNDEYKIVRDGGKGCAKVRKSKDNIDSIADEMNDTPLQFLFAVVVGGTGLLFWNVLIKVFGLNGLAADLLGYAILLAYGLLVFLVGWIACNLYSHHNNIAKARTIYELWEEQAKIAKEVIENMTTP